MIWYFLVDRVRLVEMRNGKNDTSVYTVAHPTYDDAMETLVLYRDLGLGSDYNVVGVDLPPDRLRPGPGRGPDRHVYLSHRDEFLDLPAWKLDETPSLPQRPSFI